MINDEFVEKSNNDFRGYRNDLRKLIKYLSKTGDMELPSFFIYITQGDFIGNTTGSIVYRIYISKKINGSIFNKKEEILNVLFNFDDDGVLYLLRSKDAITRKNIDSFIQLIKEFNEDLIIRNSMNREYLDSTKAFQELMEE